MEPFRHSFRKRLSLRPKFYFFDIGVVRALARLLSLPLQQSTSLYGDIFEQFIIIEILKLASYFKSEFRFSYLQTKDDVEVDLIVENQVYHCYLSKSKAPIMFDQIIFWHSQR